MAAEFQPTRGMVAAAKRALGQRAELPPSRRAMTAVGLARARDPSKGRQAWDGWGGDAAISAIRRWLRSIDPTFAANFRRLFPAR